MAITRVKSANSTAASVAASGTTTVVFGSNVAVGNVVVLFVTSGASSNDSLPDILASGISGFGATWTASAQNAFNGLNPFTYIFWAKVVSAGTTITITNNGNGPASFCKVAEEYNGCDDVLDVDSDKAGTSTTPGNSTPTSGTNTTTNANDVILACGAKSTNTAPTSGPTSSYSTIVNQGVTGSGSGKNATLSHFQVTADRIVTATGTYSTTWTFAASNNWEITQVCLKATASGTTYNDSVTLAVGTSPTITTSNTQTFAESRTLTLTPSPTISVSTLATQGISSTLALSTSPVISTTTTANQNLSSTLALGTSPTITETEGLIFSDSVSIPVTPSPTLTQSNTQSMVESETIALSTSPTITQSNQQAQVASGTVTLTGNPAITQSNTSVMPTPATISLTPSPAITEVEGSVFSESRTINITPSPTLTQANAQTMVETQSLPLTPSPTISTSQANVMTESRTLPLITSPTIQEVDSVTGGGGIVDDMTDFNKKRKST